MLAGILFSGITLHAQIKEPYKPLHQGRYSGEMNLHSPDPLITYRWFHPALGDSLQIYFLQPVSVYAPASLRLPSIKKINTEGITVTGTGDLMFDFGVESAGWLEFDSEDLPDSVEMSISEYNEPAIVNEGAQNPVKTKVPVKHGHVYRLELNDQLYEGVRFGWIHIKRFTRPWHIKNIRLVCQVHPTNYQGSFSCNDTLLTRIWYTGAYTVKLNLMKDYFGAILMERSDRQSWTGDAYPAQAAALVAFGNYDMVKANLYFTSSQQNNGIPSYSLYWVLSLIDYVNYSGDTAFFNQLAANADHRLTEAYGQYDSLSLMGYMGWDERLGAGFENPRTAEAVNTYKMLCIKTWARFARAIRISGNKNNRPLAERYERYVAEKTGLVKPADLRHFNIHSLSEAIDGNEIKMTDLSRAAASLFSDRNNRLSYSPFNQYFIIQAMARAGYYPEALQTIRDCWGGQIHYGGTSFFEVYRPSWNQILQTNDAPPNNQCGYTSLCHPWGAGVTQWLSAEILGIKPAEAGFRTFTILPHLVPGITWVKGEMPTPHGIIQASFDAVRGECQFSIPAGTLASVVGIPKDGRKLNSVWLDDRLLYKRADAAVVKNKAIREDDEFLYLTNMRPGIHHVRTQSENQPLKEDMHERRLPWKFAISQFTTDSITSGNWQGHYGKKGYCFFGGAGKGEDSRLPAGIQSVTTRLGENVVWDSTNADARAISIGLPRRASAMITRDPLATLQTMTIDVVAKDSLEHRLSLYFLDYDRRSRRSAVEIFNLDNLNIIAPVQMLRHYGNGKYLSFRCRGSIRIRINQVRGPNAAVSGLLFD